MKCLLSASDMISELKTISFCGGNSGKWKVLSLKNIAGEALKEVGCVDIFYTRPDISSYSWILSGVTSNLRYTNRGEKETLDRLTEPIGQGKKLAALIPVKKSEKWWALAQDERREIMEEKSNHIKEGIKYLPAISRKLFHSRDLGEQFDFLTWFEFSEETKEAFNELVNYLRSTEEWKYVVREIDIRLVQNSNPFN